MHHNLLGERAEHQPLKRLPVLVSLLICPSRNPVPSDLPSWHHRRGHPGWHSPRIAEAPVVLEAATEEPATGSKVTGAAAEARALRECSANSIKESGLTT